MGCCARFCRSPDRSVKGNQHLVVYSGTMGPHQAWGRGGGTPVPLLLEGVYLPTEVRDLPKHAESVKDTSQPVQFTPYLLWEGEKLESSPQSRREHISYRAGPGSWHRAGPRGLASDLLKQHPLICFMSKTAAPPWGPCPLRMLSHEGWMPPAQALRRSSCSEVLLCPT